MMPATSAVPFFCVSRVQRLAFFRVIGAYSLIWRHKNSRVLWINTTSKHWLFLLEKVICIIQFKVFACKSVFPTVSVSRVTMQLLEVCKPQKTVLRDSAKSLFFVLLQNIAILHKVQVFFQNSLNCDSQYIVVGKMTNLILWTSLLRRGIGCLYSVGIAPSVTLLHPLRPFRAPMVMWPADALTFGYRDIYKLLMYSLTSRELASKALTHSYLLWSNA